MKLQAPGAAPTIVKPKVARVKGQAVAVLQTHGHAQREGDLQRPTGEHGRIGGALIDEKGVRAIRHEPSAHAAHGL